MLTPRADELAAVTAILESDGYDDSRSMARDVIRTVAELLARRETFAVYPPGAPLGYGPYWSQTEAEKAWRFEGLGAAHPTDQGRLLRLRPWRVTDDTAPDTECHCGHRKEVHVVKVARGGKVSAPAECGVYGARKKKCECNNYSPRGK